MMTLGQILKAAGDAKASDVHLNAGMPPLFRVNTVVAPAALAPITAQMTEQFARSMMTDQRWSEFQQRRDSDFSFELPGVGRFRVNVHFQRGSVALSLRAINPTVRPLETLFLPQIVEQLARLPRGLILVTGGTGSGKSTTLAAMIDDINRRERGRIITLEDPIEYLLTSDKSCIEQREVGSDVPDFASGLRHVLRQDPDVIFVGEMRDLETTSAAITAAETGHLVLSTLHTASAAQTVDRIIDIYPSSQQNQVRAMLANSLQAVISQTLFYRKDQPGMIPAVEVLICNAAVRNCIRENRVFEIPNIIETSKALGMVSMDASIKQLVMNGYVSREDALAAATQPERMKSSLAA
jgi:twitching motility protein PilT